MIFRWQIVIHGGIDGYTRIPVYLRCSDNNRADTVLESFLSAVHEYGLPSRVRSDKGKETLPFPFTCYNIPYEDLVEEV